MEDRIKQDIYKVCYINNTNIDGDQIPEKIIVFYGRTNPVTKENWELSTVELKERFISYVQEKVTSNFQTIQEEYTENDILFDNIFSNTELENINSYKINVEFSFDRLYSDDTIETIKKKIITNLKIDKSHTFDELYIFSKRGIEYTPTQLYNKLSNNDTSTITKNSLIHFLTNTHRWNLKNECELILRTNQEDLKEEYTYDDIIELFFRFKKNNEDSNIDNEEEENKENNDDNDDNDEEEIIEKSYIPLIQDISIGQKLTYNKSEYTFTVNPFNVNTIDTFLKERAKNIISTTNKTILLDYSPIICNTIFACLAIDVLEYIDSYNTQVKIYDIEPISPNNMIQIYFPYLAEKEYNTMSDLETHREELNKETQDLVNDISYKNHVDNVNLFYDVFYQKEKDTDLKYIKKGIYYIELEIKPESIINIPIDILFKIIHTSDEKPLIKLTRGPRDEKMYRLYANKITKTGKRIPYLKRSEIKRIMKETQLERRVMILIRCIYSEYSQGEHVKDHIIFIKSEFDNTGSIFISFKLEQPLNDDMISEIIKKSVNPIIEEVATFIGQYGYSLNNFDSLYDNHVIIRELKYKTLLKLPSNFRFNIPDNAGCVSSIFNVIEYKEGQRIIMRYKRVSNYNEMEGIDAFIMQQFLKSSYQADVITGLMENYQHLTYDEALRYVSNLLDQLQLSNVNKQTKIKINSHPGFYTSIIQYQIVTTGNFEINIENIDNIYYLDNIEKMVDSLLRLLLYKKSEPNTNVPSEEITKLCKKPVGLKEKTEIKEVKEFVVQGDKSVLTDNIIIAETNPIDETFVNEQFARADDLQNIDDSILEDIFFGSDGEGDEEDDEEREDEGEYIGEVKKYDKGKELVEEVNKEVKKKTSEEENEGDVIDEFVMEDEGDSSNPPDESGSKQEEESVSKQEEGSGSEPEEESGSEPEEGSGSEKEEESGSEQEEESGSEPEEESGSEQEEGSGSEQEEGEEIEEIEFGSDDNSDDSEVAGGGSSDSEQEGNLVDPDLPSFSSDTESSAAKTPKPITPKPITTKPKKSINISGVNLSKLGASAASEDPQRDTSQESSEGVTLFQRGTMERNITGAKLSNPNPVFQRLYSYDPALFPKTTSGNVKEYSRSCPWNFRRQPIILTDEEKKHIDENHAGSYDRAMKYGSSKSKQYWYICPRYWDLKKNVSLTHEEVERIKAKEGDVVIPPGAETIPPGKYIFEFTEDKYHIDKKTGKYKSQSPGFVNSKENAGSKYCIPCCFNTENFAKDKQNLDRQACGCPSITVHNQNNPNTKSFECKGKEQAFKARPVRRVRGKGSTKRDDEGPEGSEGPEGEIEEIKLETPTATSDAKLTSAQIKKALSKLTLSRKDTDVLSDEEPQSISQLPSGQITPSLSVSTPVVPTLFKKMTAQKKDFVILGPERNTELPDGIYGYLLPQLQAFFSQSVKTCSLNEKSSVLKPGISCLLQKGVQSGEIKNVEMRPFETTKGIIETETFSYFNKNQSFLGAIADIYSTYIEQTTGNPVKISISNMKQIIIDAIDIDTFMTYQNGTLVNTFNYKEKPYHLSKNDDEDIEKEGNIEEEEDEEDEDEDEIDREPTSQKNYSQDNTPRSEVGSELEGGGSSSDEEDTASVEEANLLDFLKKSSDVEESGEAVSKDPSDEDQTKEEISNSNPNPNPNIEEQIANIGKASISPSQSSERIADPELIQTPSVLPASVANSNIGITDTVRLKDNDRDRDRDKILAANQDICIVDDHVFRLMLEKPDFKYRNSAIFKSITNFSENNAQFVFFKKVVCSFENFKNYINSKTAYIDYQYLWDLISMPNPKLFKNGVNLIILQISNRDITNNIEVLCPTNHYSNGFFDTSKDSIILIKRTIKNNTFFEPIYEIREIKPRKFSCMFNLKNTAMLKITNEAGVEVKEASLPPILKKILLNIKKAYDSECKPYNSIPREGSANASKKFPKLYEFSRNIHLYELKEKVLRGGFNILNQILNYDGRVIGIFIEKEDKDEDVTYSGIVMCEPSPIDKSISQINYIDDESLWKSYEETVIFLNYVHSKLKIPCIPRFKVIDDGKIVGVITETDQFISVYIDENESKRTDGIFNIPIINTSDYNIADTEINTRLKDDEDREKYVKYIYLENNFYNVFRTIVRILLHKYENLKIKEAILSIIKRNDMLYLIKLTNIQSLIKRLISNYINFSETHYNQEMLKSISEITTSCLTNKNPNTCSETKYCIKETDKEGRCKLVIPKINLLNPGQDNEVMYVARMSDEILRYNRIRAFMFDRNIFPFMNVKYNLREDEIILSQTMLTENYLDNLEPISKNEYVNYNTYDTSEPLLSELYESIYDVASSANIKCTTEKILLTQEYRKYFTAKQIPHLEVLKFNSNSSKCSFEIMIFIMKLEAKRRNYKRLETITINHLKIVIAQFYIDVIDKQYTEGIKDRFAKLLKYYGMESISDEYRIKFIANEDDNFIETLPFFESYHLTRLDIWILATYYKIPIIILYYPNKTLIETNNEFPILTTYYEEALEQFPERKDLGFEALADKQSESANIQGYYFIIPSAIKPNSIPTYSIIYKKRVEESSELNPSEVSGPGLIASSGSGNDYYISLNILTQKTQSIIIDQQSKQYVDPDQPVHSDDDESLQMKASLRYNNIISQFIQTFTPPLKMGKGEDISSMGTNESPIDEFDESSVKQKLPKSSRAKARINISSQQLKTILEPDTTVAENPSQKPMPMLKSKGKKSINVDSLVLPPSVDMAAASEASSVTVVPKKKISTIGKKKLDLSSLQLPTMGSKSVVISSQNQEESNLPNIDEE
jgi:hypothetical protein